MVRIGRTASGCIRGLPATKLSRWGAAILALLHNVPRRGPRNRPFTGVLDSCFGGGAEQASYGCRSTRSSLCTTSRSYSGPRVAGQLAGRAPDELGNLLGVEVHETPCDRPSRAVAQLDGVARGEVALDGRDTPQAAARCAGRRPRARPRRPARAHPRGRGVLQPQQPVGGALAGGVDTVPVSPPARASAACTAEVSAAGMPAAAAIRAASTLVTMPPVPTPALPAVPMSTCARSPGARTSTIREVPGLLGSPSYTPSTSESRTSRSARTRWATSAASRSLSPKRISSVAWCRSR